MAKGRKRKDGPRYPSGDRQRSHVQAEQEREAKSTVIDARMRLLGVTYEAAAQPDTGSAIGYAVHTKALSREQGEALFEFERVRRAYDTAILVKRVGSAGDLDKAGGFDDSDGTDDLYVDRCAAARRRYAESRRAILEAGAQLREPAVMMAVEAWALENKPLWGLLIPLRVAANVLMRLYRVEQWQNRGAA